MDDADAARAEYHRALRDLHRSGVPLRDLADQLGMSHQRVHQIVGARKPARASSGRRIGGAVGALALIVVAVASAVMLTETPGQDDAATDGPITIDLRTSDGSWTFAYPNHQVVVAGESSPAIVLPAGQEVTIRATSADVIHAMWVPRLGGKYDIIPGRTNTFVIATGSPATHTGTDAEFAGLEHQLPDFSVQVVPSTEFQRWLVSQ